MFHRSTTNKYLEPTHAGKDMQQRRQRSNDARIATTAVMTKKESEREQSRSGRSSPINCCGSAVRADYDNSRVWSEQE